VWLLVPGEAAKPSQAKLIPHLLQLPQQKSGYQSSLRVMCSFTLKKLMTAELERREQEEEQSYWSQPLDFQEYKTHLILSLQWIMASLCFKIANFRFLSLTHGAT
jgi:hypothetical protein